MRISVIGSGYVGLVSGACLAEVGHTVTCIDIDAGKIDALRAGEIPIYEPGLEELIARNAERGRISFTSDLGEGVRSAEAVFIAVGTPSTEDGHADLRYVYGAARDLAAALDGFTVVVTKSTVPVGTNQAVADILHAENPSLDFEVASNPEFLKEGAAIEDFMSPDRIVYGVRSDRAADVLDRIYKPLSDKGFRIHRTNLETAEMIKYASNAFLATKITFINQMAALCEKVGADVRELAAGMGSDARIGDRFLNAGPGYGGSCFPKDTRAIARTGQQFAEPQSIVEAVIAGNDAVKARMVDKIVELCGGSVQGQRLAIMGATFKAGTDDMRDAPSLSIVPRLVGLGAHIRICDPQGARAGAAFLERVEWCQDAYDCARNTDALVILTEWPEFRGLDLARLAAGMARPRMADLRNLYDARDAMEAGFEAFAGVGYPAVISDRGGREIVKISA